MQCLIFVTPQLRVMRKHQALKWQKNFPQTPTGDILATLYPHNCPYLICVAGCKCDSVDQKGYI